MKKLYDLEIPLMPESGIPSKSVIAIDGPAGSGKSTLARQLADHFDLLYIDTGAMYRALTWAAKQANIPSDDFASLETILLESEIVLETKSEKTIVKWNGKDISNDIRKPAIEAEVSAVAAHPEVRRAMVNLQRQLSRSKGVVMEGRDIGSVVFPLADVKLYIDAKIEIRAERRFKQLSKHDSDASFEGVLEDLKLRDELDSNRKESPLTISPDANIIDNSSLTLAEQLNVAIQLSIDVIKRSMPKMPAPDLPTANLEMVYKIVVSAMACLGRFMNLKVTGRENLIRPAGFIIAPNHISLWDPPLIGGCLFGLGAIHAVAKEELFKPWPMNHFFNAMRTIPIKRSAYDPTAFDKAAEALEQGRCIKFYPEGIRRPVGEPGPVKGGLSILMQRTKAPALPIFVRGSTEPLPGGTKRSPLQITIERPVFLDALPYLLENFDKRKINKLVSNLFENIYREMQSRSFAEIPMTDWEKEQAEWQKIKSTRKAKKTFKNK